MTPGARRSAAYEEALGRLAAGEVVGLPTDTVYGIGGLAGSPSVAERVFSLKGRPDDVALPVLVGSREQAFALAAESEALSRLADALWPGPLTLVVARRPGVELHLGGDGESVGLRFPAHEILTSLCREVGPLAVTSANRHGEAPLTTADAVRELFGGAVFVLDGGLCERPPSSVVSLVGPEPKVLRAGPIGAEQIDRVLSGL